MKEHMNYTLLCDFYELTMGNGYFQTGMGNQICYFDVFFRSVPDGGGFAIAAGLEQVSVQHLICYPIRKRTFMSKKIKKIILKLGFNILNLIFCLFCFSRQGFSV